MADGWFPHGNGQYNGALYRLGGRNYLLPTSQANSNIMGEILQLGILASEALLTILSTLAGSSRLESHTSLSGS